MKREMKICLPAYKIVYSLCYVVILSFIQGVAFVDEIGGALDANLALLAVVFCAETYVMERNGKRNEIIGLYPMGRKVRMVFRRMAVQLLYLCLLSYGGFFFFFWQRPVNLGVNSFWFLFGTYGLAVTATILFWGMLSMTLSNLFKNQWAGIGLSAALWLIVVYSLGKSALGNYGIFAYGYRSLTEPGEVSWLLGKGIGVLLAAVMTACVPYILKKRG